MFDEWETEKVWLMLRLVAAGVLVLRRHTRASDAHILIEYIGSQYLPPMIELRLTRLVVVNDLIETGLPVLQNNIL